MATPDLSNMTTIDMTKKDGEKLDMTPDEMKRFQECMKDPKFMDLWADYAQEISDPKHLKEQEEYLQQVENEAKQAGDHSFTFVFPKPCFCVRINTAKERFFINICDDEKIGEPQEETTGNLQASQWQVPVSLGKIRDDVFHDKPCKVVDACYHPKSTYLGRQSDKFMVFLVEIAVENINFTYHDEKKEIPYALPMEFERIAEEKSVGNPSAQTIRIKAVKGKEGELVIDQKKKQEESKPSEAFKGNDAFANRLAASMGDRAAKEKIRQQKMAEQRAKEAAEREAREAQRAKQEAERKRAKDFQRNLAAGLAGGKANKNFPDYTVVEQGEVGYQDCFNETERPQRKLPKSLKVVIALPSVSKATELDMGAEKMHLTLASEKHGFDGTIPLPHEVDTEGVAAKFDKTKRVLTVTLPVVQKKSDFEVKYRKVQEEKRREFREEAKVLADAEQRERAEEEAVRRAEREKEVAEQRRRQEAKDKARREVEERLQRLAEEEREKKEAERQKREAEMQKKYEADLQRKMEQLNSTKASMHEQESALREEAEKEHAKTMRKIKKEMEALKLAEGMLQQSRRKQAELPFTNSMTLELD